MLKRMTSLLLVLCITCTLVACGNTTNTSNSTTQPPSALTTTRPTDNTTLSTTNSTQPSTTPKPSQNTNTLRHTSFNGEDAYIVVNGGVPYFTSKEITSTAYEFYSELDELGRCGVTMACVGQELMPTDDRGEIGAVKPSGWTTNGKSNNNKYDFVDGRYIYNRCHLIGFQLTGENANTKNLITGTRFLNINGMLAFENMIADAVKEENLHVLYRVTPIYEGDNLLAEGVLMEGYSVEDKGATISFCVFAFNVQPGVSINYATGENWLSQAATQPTNPTNATGIKYVINTKTNKFHIPSCTSALKISEENFAQVTCTRDDLIADGYSPCGICKP